MSDERKSGIRWYEVFYVAVVLVLLTMSVIWMHPHGVGVVNLNKVARDVGFEARVQGDAKAARDAAAADINRLQKESPLAALKKQIESATDAQKEQLRPTWQAAQQKLEGQVEAVREGLFRHQELVNVSFRNRMQPVLAKIANRHNLDLILEEGPAIVYSKPKIDVTEEATQEAKPIFTPELPLIDPSIKALPAPSPLTQPPKPPE